MEKAVSCNVDLCASPAIRTTCFVVGEQESPSACQVLTLPGAPSSCAFSA